MKPIKIKNYRCKNCGGEKFFFHSVNMHMGIYCSECGRWYKWVDRDERNLMYKKEKPNGNRKSVRSRRRQK